MRIDESQCIGCLQCVPYCPVGAIKEENSVVRVDEEECVECGCCRRMSDCGAIFQPELAWPRVLRAQFSDPLTVHPSTGGGGRGTEETKTNEVTGRYPPGAIGIAVEMGRPGIGTRLADVEKVAQAILPLGVGFEKDNPTYHLFEDPAAGRLRPEVRNERVLSAILEFRTTVAQAPEVLKVLKRAAGEVDTVFSVNIAAVLEPDGSQPAALVARAAGLEIRPNGKNNLGLGKRQPCPLGRER